MVNGMISFLYSLDDLSQFRRIFYKTIKIAVAKSALLLNLLVNETQCLISIKLINAISMFLCTFRLQQQQKNVNFKNNFVIKVS